MEMEKRCFTIKELRVTREEGQEPRLVGYPVIYNSVSEDLGGFRERIAKGAFTKSLKNSDVRALLDHKHRYVLGRESADTLKLEDRSIGLYVDCTPPNTTWARDLLVSVERGDITQMSFGFRAIVDSWNEEEKIRTVLEANIFDVSVVSFPAYPDTKVALRSLEKARKQKEQKQEIQYDVIDEAIERIKELRERAKKL